MKNKIVLFLAIFLLAVTLSGCSKNIGSNEDVEPPKVLTPEELEKELVQSIIDSAGVDGPVMPEGDVTEIWFEETIRAFYPNQLDNMFFAKMYLYGETQTENPIICLCSETLKNIEVFRLIDGKKGEIVYTVDELNPMEAIVLQEEITETPHIGISFIDENENNLSYSFVKSDEGILLQEIK